MIEHTTELESAPGTQLTRDEISPDDTMFEGDLEHYLSVGRSALECIHLALAAAGKERVESVLDFGSGFGRVLRVLKATFPRAHLAACDLSRGAIDYCARTFGAEPFASSEDISQIRITSKFDLIWCGTLLTNVDAAHFRGLLELFRSLLERDGVLVFTTHGPFVARRFGSRAYNYGLDDALLPGLLREYEETGYGYLDYPQDVLSRLGVGRYGISVSKPSWVFREIESLPDVRILNYTETAWDHHQDSVALSRSGGRSQT